MLSNIICTHLVSWHHFRNIVILEPDLLNYILEIKVEIVSPVLVQKHILLIIFGKIRLAFKKIFLTTLTYDTLPLLRSPKHVYFIG